MCAKPEKPFVIGIVGGVASGKSFVARQLADMGAALIDADAIGHEVLQQPLVIRILATELGEEVLSTNIQSKEGKSILDRTAIARIVFGSDVKAREKRERLEQTVHPLIHAEAVRRLHGFNESKDPPRAVVIDAPLLLEAGWKPLCQAVLFVEVDRAERLSRAIERGWTEDQFEAREAAQMPIDEKRAAATHVVESKDPHVMRERLAELWNEWGLGMQ